MVAFAVAAAVVVMFSGVTGSARASGQASLPTVTAVDLGEPSDLATDYNRTTFPNDPLGFATVVGLGGYMACAGDGNCAAVSNYVRNTNGTDESGLAGYTEINGTWGGPVELPLPGGLDPDQTAVTIRGISCPANGQCVAVGYVACTQGSANCTTSEDQLLIETDQGGQWSATEKTVSNATAYATGVACASISSCTMVGQEEPDAQSSSEAWRATGSVSDLAAAPMTVMPLPGGDTTGALQAIACADNGTCAVVGTGDDTNSSNSAYHQFVGMATAGSWGALVNAPGGSDLTIASLACNSTTCNAVGFTGDSSQSTQALIDSSSGSDIWTATDPGGNGYIKVSCPLYGACVASGGDADTPDVAFLDGQWTPITQSGGAQVTGGTADSFVCTNSGPCYAQSTSVLEESSGVAEAVAQTNGPGDCSNSEASADGFGRASYCNGSFGEIQACAVTSCTLIGNYPNANNASEYATATVSGDLSPTTTSVSCDATPDDSGGYPCQITVTPSDSEASPPSGEVTLSADRGDFTAPSSCELSGQSNGSSTCTAEYRVPDASQNPVNVTAAYAGDTDNGASTGTGQFTPQCDTTTSTSGAWQFSGCFDDPDANSDDTASASQLDGLQVSADQSDQVDYSTGGTGGDVVAPKGSSSLSLNMSAISGGTITSTVLTNALSRLSLLGSPVTVSLPQGFNLAGLPLSGSMTFSAGPGGSATATATGTLPGILSGGQSIPVSVSLTTTMNKGVTSISASAGSGSLANVFGLNSVKLTYSAGTWTVNATAQGAGDSTQTMDGTLAYNANGSLQSGSLSIQNVVIAGLLTVKTFSVSYAPATGWTGACDLSQGKQEASVKLAFSGSTMTSGSITASGISLFQVFTLKSFAMTYTPAKDQWGLKLAVEGVKGSPSVSAELAVTAGTVTGADLDFKNVSVLKKITVDDLHLKYTTSGGHDDFVGSTKLKLPSAAVSGVEGKFEMVDGLLTDASLDLFGNVPLYGALTLNHLGGEIKLKPKREIIARVGLSAGPKTDAGDLLGVDGSLSYTFPAKAGGNGTYKVEGKLDALKKILGEATLTTDGDITALKMTLGEGGKGFEAGKRFALTGTVTGGLRGSKFTARGNVHLSAKFNSTTYGADGTVVLSNQGIVACAAIPALTKKGASGFSESWDGDITAYKGDCPF